MKKKSKVLTPGFLGAWVVVLAKDSSSALLSLNAFGAL
jgi:hypothetical protein